MRKKTQASKRRKSPNKIRTIFLSILSIVALTSFIIVSYILFDVVRTVNGNKVIDLKYYQQNQDQTTFIYAKDKDDNLVEIAKLHGEKNRVWVTHEEMSEWMGKAFVAIEDKRFYDHDGVDWYSSTLGIVNSAVNTGKVRGGSTITQQLIKNLTGEAGRNLNRKYNEMLYALNMEKYYDKDEILEAYLNTIYLSHNCYGVQTASQTYFGKDVSELNLAECAAIAGITQYPGKYDPLWYPEETKKRQKTCLIAMLDEGFITREEYDEALAYELIYTNSENYVPDEEVEVEKSTDNDVQSYYVDYIITSVIRDLKAQGYSNYEATNMIYSGGLRITAAVDMEIQEYAEDVYVNRTGFPGEVVSSSAELAQSAITIMDYSGRIVAMVGGAGEKTENRSNNRAAAAIRQPGSSIKPLSIYAPAIEENVITWSSKIKNYGINWNGKRWPNNYGGNPGSPNSYVTSQYAVAISYNTVPAQILMKMGFDVSYDYLKNKFNISTYSDAKDSESPSALATGGSSGGVTTLQMSAAFATFGNGGKYFKPYAYYEVKNNQGEVILKNSEENEFQQAISPETAYVMNQMLQTVYYGAGGTGRGYAVTNHRTFGKTGTSSSNHDRWVVGGTSYYVAAVWFGYDYNKEVRASGNPAGDIFHKIMNYAHKDLEPKEFEKDTDKVVKAAYCVGSGRIASAGCGAKAYGWYKSSNMPGVCTNCYVYGDAIGEPGGEDEVSTEPGETTTGGEGGGEDITGEPTTGGGSTPPPVTEPTAPPVTEPTAPPVTEPPTIPQPPRPTSPGVPTPAEAE